MIEKLNIGCSTENLKEIRRFVHHTLSKLSLPDHDIDMMVLAVDEICANRIIHSNQNDNSRKIEILIEDFSDGVSFNISDQGIFYDPTGRKDPSLEQLVQEKRKGGIGLMLVKKIMDSIEVKYENPTTTFKLYKRISKQA
jgi:serine/threonine-protein kinase RsbW